MREKSLRWNGLVMTPKNDGRKNCLALSPDQRSPGMWLLLFSVRDKRQWDKTRGLCSELMGCFKPLREAASGVRHRDKTWQDRQQQQTHERRGHREHRVTGKYVFMNLCLTTNGVPVLSTNAAISMWRFQCFALTTRRDRYKNSQLCQATRRRWESWEISLKYHCWSDQSRWSFDGCDGWRYSTPCGTSLAA